MIFSLVSSIKKLEIDIETPGTSQLDFNFSKQPYLFDYECALNDRLDMLEHYQRTYNSRSVEKRSGLSLQEFGDLYDSKWPVIVTDVVPNWSASSWTKDFFLERYGDERILLQAVEGRLVDGVGHIRTFREFFRHLQRGGSQKAWTYMEDEMFSQAHPEIKKDVEPNPYMEENFFKFFPDGIRPWDCMILWGSPYSRSTLHMDPYNWTAISGVIYGKKHWKLYPPGQDHYMYIEPKVKCGFPLECYKYNSPIDAFDKVDHWRYPNFLNAEYIEVEQRTGEMLIIPTGWYHQAFNSEETLSVSTQLMNRNNYLVILEEIIKAKNLSRKKLPPHFSTLLPPDQVKLFLSLLPKEIIRKGDELNKKIRQQIDSSEDKSEL
ncbi:hypothetical protein ACJMK2_007869 [Sinanodonta woodiana]|uniref:JmjC domain-containing protein n=1 Tax=Sinanodonta woodiana TaxID=1069815 RepID=A0ABD3VK99_SINWO